VKATSVAWAIGIALFLSPAAARAQYAFAGRLTTPTTGAQLTAGAQQPSVSPEGRYVALVSSSSNLGAASNGSTNVYRYDLVTDTYELATQALGTGNSNAPSISLLGLAIAFPSESNDVGTGNASGFTDVFYSERGGAGVYTTQLVSRGVGGAAPNAASQNASLSADGRWIAFLSYASNLIAGDTNGQPDVFVADAENLAAAPERISVNNGGAQIEGPSRALSPSSISADGRYVAFAVDTPVSIDGSNAGTLEDVFVRDRVAGTTELISKSTAGVAGSSSSSSPAISPSGRFVVFFSFSTNLTSGPSGSRIYLRDRQENATFNMPLPDGASSCEDPRVSDLAQIVAQCNMNSGFAQAFLYDPAGEGAFYQLSTSLTAGNGNGTSGNFTGISAYGTITVFDSAASDLVADDTNSSLDVFVVVPEPGVASASLAVVGALAVLRTRRSERRRRHSV
jgi:Tol biopolymer transport system component